MRLLDKTISQITIPTPFAVGNSHVYMMKGDVLSLIDAGVKTKEAWEAMKNQLKELGYQPSDIEQIILTHHHPDHIGLIDQFPRVESIIAHEFVDAWLTRDEAFLQHNEHFFKQYFNASGIPEQYGSFIDGMRSLLRFSGEGKLTGTIDGGMRLPGHPDFQVIETKGHAQSHLSFFRESDGTFIGGDHLLHHISSNPLIESPRYDMKGRPKPMLQYRENLKKCLSLGIRTVLPGHGKIFTNVAEIIPKRLEKQEQRADKVRLLLMKKAQTPFELCKQIFPKQYEKQLDLTMSETIGQLDYLVDEGLINHTIEDGIYYYYAT